MACGTMALSGREVGWQSGMSCSILMYPLPSAVPVSSRRCDGLLWMNASLQTGCKSCFAEGLPSEDAARRTPGPRQVHREGPWAGPGEVRVQPTASWLSSRRAAHVAEAGRGPVPGLSQLQAVGSEEVPAAVRGWQAPRSGNPESQGCRQAGKRAKERLQGAASPGRPAGLPPE